MVDAEEGNSWIYKNKDHGKGFTLTLNPCRQPHALPTGMLSAAASLGLSLLWDTDIGLSHVDKYTYSSEEYIKARTRILSSVFSSNTHAYRPVLFSPLVSLTPAFVPKPMLP